MRCHVIMLICMPLISILLRVSCHGETNITLCTCITSIIFATAEILLHRLSVPPVHTCIIPIPATNVTIFSYGSLGRELFFKSVQWQIRYFLSLPYTDKYLLNQISTAHLAFNHIQTTVGFRTQMEITFPQKQGAYQLSNSTNTVKVGRT